MTTDNSNNNNRKSTTSTKVFEKEYMKHCSQCRISEQDIDTNKQKMMRCSRCRIAHFCSQECQKKHFPVHKKICKRLAQTNEQLETHLNYYQQQQQQKQQQEEEEQQREASSTKNNKETASNKEVVATKNTSWKVEQIMLGSSEFDEYQWETFFENEQILQRYLLLKKSLGDYSLTMSYSECDTVIRGGGIGIEIALRHYLELIRIIPSTYGTPSHIAWDSTISRVEEIIALLLVALDYNDAAYHFIRYCTMAPSNEIFATCFQLIYSYEDDFEENGWIYNMMELVQHDIPENRDLIQNHLSFSVILLLCTMKRLVNLRGEREGGGGNELGTIITTTEQDIREWVKAIEMKFPGFLFHLKTTIPLLPSDRYDVFHPSSPECCWHLLQDCFFLTPGINNLLDEFVNEE